MPKSVLACVSDPVVMRISIPVHELIQLTSSTCSGNAMESMNALSA